MHLSQRKQNLNRNLAIIFSCLIISIYVLAIWRVQYTNPTTFYILLAIGALSFFSIYQILTRKYRERQEMVQKPFPPLWRTILQDNVAFYRTLSDDKKLLFETEIQVFLHETRITGIKCEVDDLTMVLAAASAEILVFSFPDFEYENLGEILIYPNAFSKDFRTEGEDRNIWGMVGTGAMANIMILAKPALIAGFQNASDKSNVGIHEFAHLLDATDGIYDGIPDVFLPAELREQWLKVVEHETKRINNGDSKMNPYGATSQIEFFAVATEYFFEHPDAMKTEKPELYALLTSIYQQDTKLQLGSAIRSMLGYTGKKVGRNAPCPCQSGKKYKDCCLQNAREY
jgi:MtfA peptidase